MAKQSKYVPIQLDRVRNLLLDYNTICAIEDSMDLSVPAVFAKMGEAGGAIGFRHVRSFLWHALRHEDPKLKLEQVGRFIEDFAEGDNFGEKFGWIISKLYEAGERSNVFTSPEEEEVEEKNPVTETVKPGDAAGIGTVSKE